MNSQESDEEDDEDEDEDEDENKEVELDLRLARLEWIMNRRPLLLSSVILRQNPQNVYEWHKRVKLMDDDYENVRCYLNLSNF